MVGGSGGLVFVHCCCFSWFAPPAISSGRTPQPRGGVARRRSGRRFRYAPSSA
jgi:hypothetical protein